MTESLAGSQAASQALSQVYTSQTIRWGWLKIAPEIHWFIIIIIIMFSSNEYRII